MKPDKKKLYEGIMSSVAKQVKKSINEMSLNTINRNTGGNAKLVAHSLAKYLIDTNESLAQDLVGVINDPSQFALFGEYLNNYIKRFTKVFESYGDDYEDEELEYITYNDVIDAVEGEDYQAVIDDEGEGIADWILDRIMCPENGANCANACVEIAERLLNGEDPDDIRAEIGDEEI